MQFYICRTLVYAIVCRVEPREENYIMIISDSAFNMKDVRIEIKNAPGIIVYAFSDIDGDDFLFYKEVISSFSLILQCGIIICALVIIENYEILFK